MTPIIYRQTTYKNKREITTICVFGVPVFKRVIIDNDDIQHRSCGFNVFSTDAPGHFKSDFDDEDDWNDTGCKSGDSNGDK